MNPIRALAHLIEESLALNTLRTAFPETLLTQRESLIAHTYRTAIIAATLASRREEEMDVPVTTALFHNLTKARVPELTALQAGHVIFSRKEILQTQIENLPPDMQKRILDRYDPQNVVFKDAEQLSYAFEFLRMAQMGFGDAGQTADRLLYSPEGRTLFEKLANTSILRMDSNDPEISFLLYANALVYEPRTGLPLSGFSGETVGEHTGRVALIAYLLAELEGEDGTKAAVSALLHDIPEIYSADQNALSKAHVKLMDMESVFEDICPFHELRIAYHERDNAHVKDADMLEHCLETHQLACMGTVSMRNWPMYLMKKIETKTARAILEVILQDDLTRWHYGEGRAIDIPENVLPYRFE